MFSQNNNKHHCIITLSSVYQTSYRVTSIKSSFSVSSVSLSLSINTQPLICDYYLPVSLYSLSPFQFVTIKCGSLETTTEALHPHMRHKSMRYLKAGYTAGSMAGLGFSMAILGTCVGIFVGFLLWKRHSSVPYQVTEWRHGYINLDGPSILA